MNTCCMRRLLLDNLELFIHYQCIILVRVKCLFIYVMPFFMFHNYYWHSCSLSKLKFLFSTLNITLAAESKGLLHRMALFILSSTPFMPSDTLTYHNMHISCHSVAQYDQTHNYGCFDHRYSVTFESGFPYEWWNAKSACCL